MAQGADIATCESNNPTHLLYCSFVVIFTQTPKANDSISQLLLAYVKLFDRG
jgi:hypothetical protein